MSDPVFFLIRRTARQIRIHAAEGFTPDGMFIPLRRNHAQAEEVTLLLNAFTVVARDLPPNRIKSQVLIDGARRYILPDIFDRLRVLSANTHQPERICLRGAA